ncbi:MAG: ATP-binding protein [Sneathiellales bacterium]|nr:ATP-binding protein [Sneathiellales bacterium]
MKTWRKTIAGRLTLVTLVAVLLSQCLIFLMFYTKIGTRIDEYEDRSVRQVILHIYQTLKQASPAERARLVKLTHSPEAAFSVSTHPVGSTLLPQDKIDEIFGPLNEELTIYYEEVKPRVSKVIDFWFSLNEDYCFMDVDPLLENTDCPHRILSFQIDSGSWLIAKVEASPDTLLVYTLLIFSSFVTFIGIMIFVYIAIRKITAPLEELTVTAEKFGKGEMTKPLKVKGPYELATTVNSFNLMQERISRFMQDRTKMLAAISHDLRTPITAMRIQAEFIAPEEPREKIIATLDEMQKMVESSLTFSKQEILEEESVEIDLVHTLRTLSEEVSSCRFKSPLTNLHYRCRGTSIKRAIRNLIVNSNTYGVDPVLSLECEASQIEIKVRDHGPGVPESKLKDIFNPFTRLDEARNTQSGSVGLGLAICKTIIQKHGGSVLAKNAHPGLEIQVILPLGDST